MALETLGQFNYPADRALHVGLTGGIGAGKSTVAQVFRHCGAVVVDADELARKVVEVGSVGLAQLTEKFGPEIVGADGSLHRGALARVIFADPEALNAVESTLHPLIAAEKDALFEGLGPGQVGVYDVPLLAEKNMGPDFDVVVVVESSREARLQRLKKRGLSRSDAEQRMDSQATDVQRREIATFLLTNDGTEAELRRDATVLAEHHLGM